MGQDRRFAGLRDLFGTDILRQRLQPLLSIRKAKQLQDDAQFVTLQVGKSVWEQAPRQMRIELWMSSLQRKGIGVAAAAKFEDMLLTTPNQEAAVDIEKDISRTFPNMKRFAAAEGQEALRRVLLAYAAYDPEVGYCQGLNFVAGLLLMYLPERHAFGGLVVLMHDRGLRNYYSIDMSLLQTHLWQLGRLMPQRLCAHLEGLGVLPLLYGASWLMTCFSADFPESFSARVMDVIMADKMDQALLKAAVGLLKRCEQRLLDVKDMEDCLALLKEELPSWEEQQLHDVLTEAFRAPWSSRQLALLGSVEGSETVAEAVARVQKANLEAAAAAASAGGASSEGNSTSDLCQLPAAAVVAAAPGEQQRQVLLLLGDGDGSNQPAGRISNDSSSGGQLLMPPPPSAAARRPSRGSLQQGAAAVVVAAGGASAAGGVGALDVCGTPPPPSSSAAAAPAAAAAGSTSSTVFTQASHAAVDYLDHFDFGSFTGPALQVAAEQQSEAAIAGSGCCLLSTGSHPAMIDMSSPTASNAETGFAAAVPGAGSTSELGQVPGSKHSSSTQVVAGHDISRGFMDAAWDPFHAVAGSSGCKDGSGGKQQPVMHQQAADLLSRQLDELSFSHGISQPPQHLNHNSPAHIEDVGRKASARTQQQQQQHPHPQHAALQKSAMLQSAVRAGSAHAGLQVLDDWGDYQSSPTAHQFCHQHQQAQHKQ